MHAVYPWWVYACRVPLVGVCMLCTPGGCMHACAPPHDGGCNACRVPLLMMTASPSRWVQYIPCAPPPHDIHSSHLSGATLLLRTLFLCAAPQPHVWQSNPTMDRQYFDEREGRELQPFFMASDDDPVVPARGDAMVGQDLEFFKQFSAASSDPIHDPIQGLFAAGEEASSMAQQAPAAAAAATPSRRSRCLPPTPHTLLPIPLYPIPPPPHPPHPPGAPASSL